MMAFNSLIDFCFYGSECKYIPVNSYRAHWVKNGKDNVICLNKQQIKDAIAYLLCNCYITVEPKIFCQVTGIPMGFNSASFFVDLFSSFYQSKWINQLKKNDQIKARKPANIFRLIHYLHAVNDCERFESSYWNIYPEEIQLGKENTNKYETGFFRLRYQNRGWEVSSFLL